LLILSDAEHAALTDIVSATRVRMPCPWKTARFDAAPE
jgi:hypothetical protein